MSESSVTESSEAPSSPISSLDSDIDDQDESLEGSFCDDAQMASSRMENYYEDDNGEGQEDSISSASTSSLRQRVFDSLKAAKKNAEGGEKACEKQRVDELEEGEICSDLEENEELPANEGIIFCF